MPSSPNGPCSTGNTASAPSSPRPGAQRQLLAVVRHVPSRSSSTEQRLVAGRAQALAHRRAARERDLVLGRAPAGEDGDPHWRRPGVASPPSVPASGSAGGVKLPTTIVTRAALAWPCRRPADPASSTMPSSSSLGHLDDACARTLKPASDELLDRVVLVGADGVRHVDLRGRLGDDERRPSSPWRPRRRPPGPGSSTVPGSAVVVLLLGDADLEARRPRASAAAASRCCADDVRDRRPAAGRWRRSA